MSAAVAILVVGVPLALGFLAGFAPNLVQWWRKRRARRAEIRRRQLLDQLAPAEDPTPDTAETPFSVLLQKRRKSKGDQPR